MALSTVLLDLDGVVRHFDPAHVASVEDRYGLRRGILESAAFESGLLERAITGRIRRSEWVHEVGVRVEHPIAAAEWLASRGTVDESLLAEVDGLRSRGVVVAVLTNGTSTIPHEMEALGLDIRFDAVFNGADLGVAKPDKRVFEEVSWRLGTNPTDVFFTDDSAPNLAGAIEIGMTARRFETVDSFRAHLAELVI